MTIYRSFERRRNRDHTGGNGAFFAIVRWWRDLDVTLVVTNSDFSRRNAAALLDRVGGWVASTAGDR